MAYCTLEDLVKRFGLDELVQLTDDVGNGLIDSQKVQSAIDDATSEIDGWIAGRYTLPLENTPATLVRICANIARYNLYDDAVSDLVQKQYDASVKFVMSVGKGEISLGPSPQGDVTESDTAIEIQSEPSVFARAVSKDFI